LAAFTATTILVSNYDQVIPLVKETANISWNLAKTAFYVAAATAECVGAVALDVTDYLFDEADSSESFEDYLFDENADSSESFGLVCLDFYLDLGLEMTGESTTPLCLMEI